MHGTTFSSAKIGGNRALSFLLAGVLAVVLLGAAPDARGPWAPALALAADAHLDPKLGLVSERARGQKRYLVILVNFPEVQPRVPLEAVKDRAVARLDQWYRAASYGQTSFVGTVVGPYTLPQRLETYRVSPYNYQVDSRRVYALVRDALSAAEEDGVALNHFEVVAVIHRCFTMPGQGYGMICYCANPGMLSKVKMGRAKYDPIQTRRGTVFQKGVVVMAENFHLGFLAHDLAHALGGVHRGARLAGDLYDFAAQSRPRTTFLVHDPAIYLGPWDIMSQHFLEKGGPPPGFSLFTMIRLGYVHPEQVTLLRPGETALVRLSPLAAGGPVLGVKIPLSKESYLLVENRQPVNLDQVLPASGVMLYEVDEAREEGEGLVRAMNADPAAPNFSRAPFGGDGQARLAWVDPGRDVAVVPVVKQGQDYLVLVTAARQAAAGEAAARNLLKVKDRPDFPARRARVLDLLKSGRVAEGAAAAAGP